MSKHTTSLNQAHRELPSVATILDLDKIAGKHHRPGKCTITRNTDGKRLYIPFPTLQNLTNFLQEARATHEWVKGDTDLREDLIPLSHEHATHSAFAAQPDHVIVRFRTWCAHLRAPGFTQVIPYVIPGAAEERHLNLTEHRLGVQEARDAATTPACQDDGRKKEFQLTGEQIRTAERNSPRFAGIYEGPGRTWGVYHSDWHRVFPDATPGQCPWAATD